MRIFTEGFEHGDTRFWEAGNSTALTVPVPVDGLYCCNGSWPSWQFRTLNPSLTECFIRFRYRDNLIYEMGRSYPMAFRDDTIVLAGFGVDALGKFKLYKGDNITNYVSSLVAQPDVWYLIEIRYKFAVGGALELYVDGDLLISEAVDTTIPLHTGFNNIGNWSTAYHACYYDDLALNDISNADAKNDDSWCGDGMIVKMIPDGDGAHNNWTNSDGDSIANWSYVDEFPNDGDLSYVFHDGSDSGVQDQYTLTDLDYTNKTVLRIYPEARARESAPSANTLKLGILPNGGVDELSAGRTLPSGYYARIVGDEYKVNPVDSLPWEEADLDSLQFIAEVG